MGGGDTMINDFNTDFYFGLMQLYVYPTYKIIVTTALSGQNHGRDYRKYCISEERNKKVIFLM